MRYGDNYQEIEEVRQEQRRDPIIAQVVDALHQNIQH